MGRTAFAKGRLEAYKRGARPLVATSQEREEEVQWENERRSLEREVKSRCRRPCIVGGARRQGGIDCQRRYVNAIDVFLLGSGEGLGLGLEKIRA